MPDDARTPHYRRRLDSMRFNVIKPDPGSGILYEYEVASNLGKIIMWMFLMCLPRD